MRSEHWLLQQLPAAMIEADAAADGGGLDAPFTERFMTIFERVAETVFVQIDSLPHAFDPTIAPPAMVRLMARWIGIDWIDSALDERVQRAALMKYRDVVTRRGTKPAVTLLLELLTGGRVTVTDSGGVYARVVAARDEPYVRIDLETTGRLRLDDLVMIVRDELPVGVTFDMFMEDEAGRPDNPVRPAWRKVWPFDDDADNELVLSGGHLPEFRFHRPAAASGPRDDREN